MPLGRARDRRALSQRRYCQVPRRLNPTVVSSALVCRDDRPRAYQMYRCAFIVQAVRTTACRAKRHSGGGCLGALPRT